MRDNLSATAREIDGLRVDSRTGEFWRRGLIPGWVIEGAATSPCGVLELAWLAVRPDADSANSADIVRVTSRLLRSVPVAVLLGEIRQRLLQADAVMRSAHMAIEAYPATAPAHPRVGRRRRIDDPQVQARLRRLAIAYLDQPNTPGVYARLSRRFGRSQEVIKAEIRAARTDGWLGPAAHGSRGAEAGPRLSQAIVRDRPVRD